MIYPAPREDLTDAEFGVLARAGWEPSPIGGGWWRDPQTRRDFAAHRALEIARRDIERAPEGQR